MPYRDAIAALEMKLRGLYDARRELDLSIKRTRRELRHHRRPQRRARLKTAAALILVLAIVLACLAFAILPMIPTTCSCGLEQRSTVRTLKGAAELYVARGGDCPTVEDLIDGGLVDEDQQTTDAWDQPFRIECHRGRVGVASAGPDGVHGTCDDIATWHRPDHIGCAPRAPIR